MQKNAVMNYTRMTKKELIAELRKLKQGCRNGESPSEGTPHNSVRETSANPDNIISLALSRRDAILEAVNYAAQKLILTDDWRKTIVQVLSRLTRAAEVSRTYIFEVEQVLPDELIVSQRFESVKAGVTPQIDNPALQHSRLSENGFGRWVKLLQKGCLIAGHVEDFPPAERTILFQQDIQSILIVPVMVNKKIWGFMGFDACGKKRDWCTMEVSFLQSCAIILGSVIQRQEAENHFVKQQNLIRTITDTIPDLIFAKDCKGRFIFANTCTAKAMNVKSQEELLGKTDFDFMKQKYAEEYFREEQDIIRTGKGFINKEISKKVAVNKRNNRHDDGGVYASTKVPLKDAKGNIIGIVGLNRDISALKKVQIENLKLINDLESRVAKRTRELSLLNEKLSEQIRENELAQEHALAVVNAMPESVSVFDFKGRFIRVNRRFQDSSGWTATELIGKTAREIGIIDEETALRIENEVVPVLRNGKVIHNCEITIYCKDGTRIPVLSSWSVLKNLKGKPMGILSVARNIIDLKQAQDKLKTLAAELSLTEQRTRRQIADELHDNIGQNLAFAMLKLQDLSQQTKDSDIVDPLEEVIHWINGAIHNIRSLIFNMGNPILYKRGLEAALEDCLTDFAKQHDFRAKFICSKSPGNISDAISYLLFEATRELLTNVAKHAHANKITVSIEQEKDEIVISVMDDGIGFSQADNKINTVGHKGFGLFSIRERLEHVRGSLDIKSSKSKGTTIILRAPLSI